MSPGPTFDRVYASLKDQLLRGRWAPGAHLEPGMIAEDLNASITPVREALHRLVGERVVEAPRHDGFWVPMMTEAELRGLYAWHGGLVGWALRWQRRPLTVDLADESQSGDLTALFIDIARGSDNAEIEHAVAASGERLAACRAVEAEVLAGISDEHAEIRRCLDHCTFPALRRKLAGYHRRRERAAPLILAARRRAADPSPRR
jgi:hypothetical protein